MAGAPGVDRLARQRPARRDGAPRAVLVAAVSLLGAAIVVALVSASASGHRPAAVDRAARPSGPLDVAVTPGVGRLTVSWRAPATPRAGSLTYLVRSTPTGLRCRTSRFLCSFPHINDATPWSFTVRASDAAGSGPPTVPTGPVPHLTLLVVAGQSNAIGSESYVVDPSTHRDVFAGSSASPADEHALLTWDESGVTEEHLSPVALMTPQVPPGTQSPIFGPEVGLARSLYAAGRRHLLVVKVCFSGTSLAVDWRVSGDLFARLVSSVRGAQRWASANGWSASVGAVYWVQGETDAEHGDMASTYGANLLRFISSARADLGLNRRTPFVIGRIDISEFVAYKRAHHFCNPSACAQELRWNAEVRDAQAAVARSVQAVRVVDTEALPRVAGQFLHLSDRAELWLGAAFAKDSLTQLT